MDYVLHPVLSSPSPAALVIAAIAAAGRSGMLTLLHCEDGPLVRFAGAQLLAGGHRRALAGRRGPGTAAARAGKSGPPEINP